MPKDSGSLHLMFYQIFRNSDKKYCFDFDSTKELYYQVLREYFETNYLPKQHINGLISDTLLSKDIQLLNRTILDKINWIRKRKPNDQ